MRRERECGGTGNGGGGAQGGGEVSVNKRKTCSHVDELCFVFSGEVLYGKILQRRRTFYVLYFIGTKGCSRKTALSFAVEISFDERIYKLMIKYTGLGDDNTHIHRQMHTSGYKTHTHTNQGRHRSGCGGEESHFVIPGRNQYRAIRATTHTQTQIHAHSHKPRKA